jgi:endonuclease/exonuclease/phosphatase family metal-dependent hydrolase
MKNIIFLTLMMGLLNSCETWKSTTSPATNAPTTVQQYLILSYNVENFFDTINDPENDEDFTPKGKLQWDSKKYFEKSQHIAEVISTVTKQLDYPLFIGLIEVEHLSCLETLSKESSLQNKYTPLLIEGEDERGIDVGCLYDANRFKKNEVLTHTITLPDNDKTRPILEVNGTIEGQPFSFFINHWPSRSGGTEKSAPLRMLASETLQKAIAERKKTQPNCQIICMGDFNDHPNDPSVLSLAEQISSCPMSNLMTPMMAPEKGSHFYKGEWGFLDQFIISKEMASINKSCEKSNWCVTQPGVPLCYDFLMYTNKQNEKSPARTYVGDSYKGGYSDHLPILMILEKH